MAVAKENGLEIEIVHEEPAKGVSAEYFKINPLGKVPTFQGDDGFVLSECIAIAIYRECCVLLMCCLGDGLFGSVEKCWNQFLALPMVWCPLWLRNVLTSVVVVTAQNEGTTLLGKTKQDYVSIRRLVPSPDWA